MAAKLNLCGQITRIVFILLNILFLVIGLALIGIGGYLVGTNNDLDFFTGNQYVGGSALLIIAGGIVVLITVPGILGAVCLWKIVLIVYVIFIAVIIILEIVAGIVGFVYRNEITDITGGRAREGLNEYREEGGDGFQSDVNSAIDYIQIEFKCCGWEGPDDWNSTYFWVNSTEPMMYPDSCNCTSPDNRDEDCQFPSNGQVIYNKGCEDGVTDFFRSNLAIVGAIGIAFGILQVLSFLCGIGVLVAMRKANEYTTV